MKRLFTGMVIAGMLAGVLATEAVTDEPAGRHEATAGDAVLTQGVALGDTADGEQAKAIRAVLGGLAGAAELAEVKIDYPSDGSVFPPEIVAPRFLWHDAAKKADRWLIDVQLKAFDRFELPRDQAHIYVLTRSAPIPAGEIDPECVGETNEIYRPTPYQASANTWMPSDDVWAAIKENSVERLAYVTIVGFDSASPGKPLSRGGMTMKTSKDPVGAPIFYRDVPLMPSKTEEGVIKPLAKWATRLIGWRLKDIARRDSQLVLKDMPACANCHSFSSDGKTLGMDMDGPDGDKGAYAIAPIQAEMAITHDEIITWNSFEDKPEGHRTIGFLSQISPDGQYAVTTLNEEVYVANFTNYKFLQVFYPTRGILAYYSVETGRMKALSGADDPKYVHCDGVWSPDGKTIVFARAEAKDAYIDGKKRAAYPNDPAETPMQYGLYRMPFNGGRGGEAEPIEGASNNGMSNTFPKVSPDGKYVVFVKCKNGQLMRPDGRLWIVPMEGGVAQEMECNTTLMNSWHSFSPNGRWMVFSSKVNTPYTQMFLTHLDEEGRSTPPILVSNATASNRAVNIPEFVNIPYEGLVSIEAPSVEHYRHFNRALELMKKKRWDEAIATLRKALRMEPQSAKSHVLLGMALSSAGRNPESIAHFEQAIEINPAKSDAQHNLSQALFMEGRDEEAIARFKTAFEMAPRCGRVPKEYVEGIGREIAGDPSRVAAECRARLARKGRDMSALLTLASLRASASDPKLRNGKEAVALARRACEFTGFKTPETLDILAGAYAETGRFEEAVRLAQFTLWFARAADRKELVPGAQARLELYRQGKPFRRGK